MNHYETVFILNPVLSETQIKETVKKYEDFLVSKGAKMIAKEGNKKISLQSRTKKVVYHLFEYTVSGEAIAALELEFRRDERFMLLNGKIRQARRCLGRREETETNKKRNLCLQLNNKPKRAVKLDI